MSLCEGHREDAQDETDAVQHQNDDNRGTRKGVVCRTDCCGPNSERHQGRDPDGADDQLTTQCACDRGSRQADDQPDAAEDEKPSHDGGHVVHRGRRVPGRRVTAAS